MWPDDQERTIALLSELIGAYALPILLAILVLVLGAIYLIWRLVDTYSSAWWRAVSAAWQYVADSWPIRWLRQRFPWLWTFLNRRLSPEGYLGLHVTIGLALIGLALALFAGMADDLGDEEALVAFDQALVRSLDEHATPDARVAFLAITRFGDPPVLTALGFAVGIPLLIRRRWLKLITWGIALGGGAILNWALKAFFARTRPELPNPFVVASGWSFPSGHAMVSLIAYGMLGYLLVRTLDPRWHRLIVMLTVLLVLLIGASRMYLGVHYFSDVLAGYAVGVAWLFTCITGMEVARRHYDQRRRVPLDQESIHSTRSVHEA